MADKNPTYTRTAIALHWIVFALIAVNVGLAWTMLQLPFGVVKQNLFTFHKWIGVTVLWVALGRVAWRLLHKAPPLLPMPRWQSISARTSHFLLYLLMLVVPVTGYLFSSAMGYRITWFGLVSLPTVIDENMDWAVVLRNAHILLAIGLVILVIVHALAALKHYYVDKDKTLQRMLPFLRSRSDANGGSAVASEGAHDA